MTDPKIIGVIGSGAMGAGIAQLGCMGGIETRLWDSNGSALEAGMERITSGLQRGVERGRWSQEDADAALTRLRPAGSAGELAGVELVIEAVPEDLELKVAVLHDLPDDVIIATNTSSLSVTAIAARIPRAERVVGMHFFNPPPSMRLVEIVRGSETSERAVELARMTAIAMGREPIEARDSPGFVVNRGARPFYTESLRLVDEGVATPEQVDRICRIGAGFRMGPFELMDLVGIDVGLAVAKSFARQSHGEPRWLPSQSQQRLVSAGRLGRKSGRGWYDYRAGAHRPDDPSPPDARAVEGERVAILGHTAETNELRDRARKQGLEMDVENAASQNRLVICVDPAIVGSVPEGVPLAVSCATSSLASFRLPDAVGFHLLPPIAEATVLELTRLPGTSSRVIEAVEAAAVSLGLHAEWVDDAPGLVLGRIVPQLVNEACFALGEGIATPEDMDQALRLGVNHPWGPVSWGERIGWQGVLDRIDALWTDRHDPRYRAAPLLRRAAATGLSVRQLVDGPRGAWE
jgi:3-hydroxybutyryl-CoA dehydrogenase